MEEEIGIIAQYEDADSERRLNLYLQFSYLRSSFDEIELKESAEQEVLKHPVRQNNKEEYSLFQSCLARIFGIQTFKY
jgi:hypothetical protein